MTRSKYHAVRCEVDGEKFDSKLEMRRWIDLRIMERTGKISGIVRQKAFPLMVGEVEVGQYVADFVYRDTATGSVVIEDAKGVVTPLCRWKLKHMAAQGNPVTLWPPKKVKARKPSTRKAKA